MQFLADLRGMLALFSLFLVDILSRSQFLTHPTLFLCQFEHLVNYTLLVVHARKQDPVGSMLSPFWH